MSKEMLINVSAGEECRIAVVEDGKLQELYMERTSATSHVGNIYKGKVTNVEPSIQAAFIDFGIGRNGFLHISDLMPTYFGKGRDYVESVGQKLGRRDRPPIQSCLRRGDEIIVQIIKEGIGTKGPTLTTYLSVPGRVLVMMPGMQKMGVSKKIEDETERRRLRTILDGLEPPEDCGFIIRTAGVGKSQDEIERDLKYLARLWETVKKLEAKATGPTELYTEGDLVTRTVRDVFTADVERIICDDKEIAKKVKDFIKLSMPRTKNKVELYEEHTPLFHEWGIEKEIELMYSRTVPLPSGGSLVIDSTEAVVAIDVNSGKFREHNDAEMTAFKTDMEAAEEIPRQLKLRDLGGVIICDFIDLRFERHRRELEQKLYDKLKDDRAKTRMLRMSQFGIVEMTRQRMRPSLKRSIYHDCPACRGAGLVKTAESMSLDLMRHLAMAAADERVVRIHLTVGTDTAFNLLNKKRNELVALEEEHEKKILVQADGKLAIDESKLELFDARDGLVFIGELGMSAQQHAAALAERGGRSTDSKANRPGGGSRKGGRHGDEDPLDADDLRDDEEQQPQARSDRDRDEPAGPAVRDLRTKNRAPVQADLDDEDDEQDDDEQADARPVDLRRKPAARPAEGDESDAHRQAERDLAQAEADEEAEEASDVIDVDDTDESAPGEAADAFFDPNSREHREQREFAQRRQNGPRRDQPGRGRDNRDAPRGNAPRGDAQRNVQRGDAPREDRNRQRNDRPDQARGPQPQARRDAQPNRPQPVARTGGDDAHEDDNRGNRVPDLRNKGRQPAPVVHDDDDIGNRAGPPVVPQPPGRRRGGKQGGRHAGGKQQPVMPIPVVLDLRSPDRRPSNPPVEIDDAPDAQTPPELEADLEVEVPGPGNEALPEGTPDAAADTETGDPGTKKRRRRRRGGRGRRRGGREDEQGDQPEGQSGAGHEEGDDETDDAPAAGPVVNNAMLPGADADESGQLDRVPAGPSRFGDPIVPAPKPARRSAAATRVPPPIAVVKTGSTDAHLVDDEPIAAAEPMLPTSRDDLDDVPDYDED